jgi:small nuclear ribonucleoprotein (snRNP)-like protein
VFSRCHLPGRPLRWFALLLLTILAAEAAAKYDDTVFLKNGDRIIGDVKELSRDLLRYKTDAMDTVYIRWDDIASIETSKSLRIELKNGRRLVGSIGRADGPEQLVISTSKEDEIHHLDELVAFVPLKLQQAWVDRIDGGVKFGLSGNKGSSIRWTVGANGLYRGEDWELSGRFDSILTNRTDGTDSERINFVTNYRRLLRERWFWTVVGGYDKNDELGIDDRWSLGGGAGRFFVRNNSLELMFNSGLLASREFRADGINNAVEVYLNGGFAWFKHRFPKTDLRTDVLLLPSLTDSGRFRSNWDVSVSREIVTDLSLDLSVYYTTDNKPPNESAKDDWGIVTAIEYEF